MKGFHYPYRESLFTQPVLAAGKYSETYRDGYHGSYAFNDHQGTVIEFDPIASPPRKNDGLTWMRPEPEVRAVDSLSSFSCGPTGLA